MSVSKKYTGPLSVPSKPDQTLQKRAAEFTDVRTQEDAAALLEKFAAERDAHESAGLDLLCEYYAISGADRGDRFRHLALALARDHVPYFHVPHKTRGRKSGVKKAILLEIDIALYRKMHAGCSVKKAIEKLCETTEPWRRVDTDTLRRRHRARLTDQLVKPYREAAARYPVSELKKMRQEFSR